MNFKSVIETLNGIIACNEDYDINTGNLHVVVDENCGYADINTLEEAGVNVVFTEAFDGAQTPEEKRRKDQGTAGIHIPFQCQRFQVQAGNFPKKGSGKNPAGRDASFQPQISLY